MTDPVALRLAAFAKSQAGSRAADPATGSEAAGASFAQMLEQAARGALDTAKSAEETAMAGMTGEAGLRQVVEAVTAAELSLQTATAVRDKVIAAYQEIIRMPI